MAQAKKKGWKTSKHKWDYLKVAFMYFTTPTKVYELAHKSSSSSFREKMIRAKLVELGVMRVGGNPDLKPDINLDNGHI